MKRAIIIIGLLAAIVFGTGWRGGNTADYNADTICAVKYKIHPPTTDIGCEGCKPIIQMLPCIPVVIAGDTLCLPVLNLDSLADTVYIASDTLYIDTSWIATETVVVAETVYNYDTVVYIQQGNAFWTAINRYMCDSTIVAIDTTTSPYDTVWCKFCDSVLVITWWQRTETPPGIERYAYWELLTDNVNDTCDIYRPGRRNLTYTVCYDCDTNIYIDTAIFIDSTFLENVGIWVVDSLTGETYYVNPDDTVYLHRHDGGHANIWWRYCNGDSEGYIWSDTLDLFTCIDTTWEVCWRPYDFTNGIQWNVIIPYIQSSCEYIKQEGYSGVYYAVQDSMAPHYNADYGGYYENLIRDSLDYYFGVDSIIVNDGADTILGIQSIWMDWDTTDWYGAFTRPCDCHCYQNYEFCQEFEGYAYHCGCSSGGVREAELLLFRKSIDFRNYYTEEEIIALNNTQPHWEIVTIADDFVAYISINGELFYLDTVPDSFYYWHKYEIAPSGIIDYTQPVMVEIGMGSNIHSWIGGQVLIGLQLDTSYTAWHSDDSLVIPPCCPDTLCFEYRRRINYQDSATYVDMGANVICSDTTNGEKYCWVVIDSCYSTCIDTVIYEYSPRIAHIAGGASEFDIKTDLVVHDTSVYLRVYNEVFNSDSMLLFISKSGNGYDVEQVWIGLPDSVKLNYSVGDTPIYNFVYYKYNKGQPVLVDTNINILHDANLLLDSVVVIGEYLIGEIDTSADTVEIFNYHDFRNTVNKNVLNVNCNLLQETNYESGITPTIRAKSVAISDGYVVNNKHIQIPARDNRNGDDLIVVNWADSNYAHFDSLSDIYEYSDGTAFGAGEYLWMVLWGAASTDTSKFRLYLNVQSGDHKYTTRNRCEQDKWHMIPTTIPDEFKRTGFLIAAFIWSVDGDSTVKLSDGNRFKDLRGLNPQIAGGVAITSTDSLTIIDWGFYNSDIGHLQADSIKVGNNGNWIKEISIDASGDTLWFIIGADTFYAPHR